MSKLIAVHGATCEADGHPADCKAVVSGSTEDDDGMDSVTINGAPITDHGDIMRFESHAHTYGGDPPSCGGYDDHDLTPDQTTDLTINGKSVVRVGDSTSDPNAGTASVVDSGGNSDVTHTQ